MTDLQTTMTDLHALTDAELDNVSAGVNPSMLLANVSAFKAEQPLEASIPADPC